jgi:TPP-dependent pyruvate/acetoin dehydrogenase alpha subunit
MTRMTTRTREAVAAALAGSNGFSIISNEKLLQLYATMVKCRMIAERARILLEQNNLISNFDAVAGQEAVAVGVTLDLLKEDSVAFSQNGVVFNFIKGISLEMIFGALPSYAAQPNFDAQLKRATGVALENKRKANGRVTVVFCGSGSASPEFWHDALSLADARQLPILFVCQNNFSAGPLRHKKRSGVAETALKEEACSFPAIAVDGNDVVAVYRVATESIAHARRGNGPTLIECKVERSKSHDPIRKMEAYLMRKGLFGKEMKIEIAAGFTRQMDAAAKAVETSRFPGKIELSSH